MAQENTYPLRGETWGCWMETHPFGAHESSFLNLKLVSFYFISFPFDPTHGMQKFLGQESNRTHIKTVTRTTAVSTLDP